MTKDEEEKLRADAIEYFLEHAVDSGAIGYDNVGGREDENREVLKESLRTSNPVRRLVHGGHGTVNLTVIFGEWDQVIPSVKYENALLTNPLPTITLHQYGKCEEHRFKDGSVFCFNVLQREVFVGAVKDNKSNLEG